ncbi:MAG: DNA-3-methyladenine glycosylase I [Chlamydiae bacterium]|nr:DNA-3-methyladenine glycosylase I [Chlamydiota bacterium]
MQKKRCFGEGKPFYAAYHDEEWGIAVFEDQKLFEMLILEGMQAGLSWETILKRRDNYRKAFHRFDPKRVAAMTDGELEELLSNPGVIRNRLKIFSARQNALTFLEIQEEFGSFSNYLWQFVDNQPIQNHCNVWKEVPCSSLISDAISKDLKKRGMSFVGSKIIYAYMQAVGLIDDHLTGCWRRVSSEAASPPSA